MTLTSDDVKASLINRIATGLSAVGTWLPSCRSLAAELAVSPNTVHKAYSQLVRDGILQAVPGKGYKVTSQPGDGAPSGTNPMRRNLVAAARHAMMTGMDEEAFLRAAAEVAETLFAHQKPLVGAVECNEHDAKRLAGEIAAALSVRAEPLLTFDLQRNGPELAAGYDLICAPLNHLSEVRRLMGKAGDDVVGVHTPPDTLILLELAGLDPARKIGLVCEQADTRKHLEAAVSMVFEGSVRSCLLSRRQALQEMARSIDILVDVPSCHQEIVRLFPSLPTMTVGFRLDPNSLPQLRIKLAEVQSERARRLDTGVIVTDSVVTN